MNENVSDVDLERFLRRRDRISQEYAALPAQGPAPELDAAVLERARRALDEDPQASKWRRARWPRITALAATVVLSFAAIVRLAIETEEPVLAPLADRQPVESKAAAPAPEADATRADDSEQYEPAPAGAASAGVPLQSASRATTPAYASPAPASVSRSPAAATPRAAASSANTGTLRAKRLRYARDTDQAAASTAAPGAAAESDVARPMSAESAHDSGAEEVTLSDEAQRRLQKREQVIAERERAPVERALVRKDAVAPAPPRTPRPPEDATMDGVQVTGSRAAAPAAALEPAAAAESTDASARSAQERDPSAWLREIERLRAEGRFEQAERELKRLREAHPDYAPAQEQAPTR